MNGIRGKPGWAWIFIVEGLFSIVVGLVGFFVVPSTPCDSKFLTENQKYIIMSRLERDRPPINPVDKFTFKDIMRSASSPHVIMVFIMFFMVGTTLYGLALFLPSIVNELELSANKTQLLSVGPFVVGFFVTVISACLSDRYESRGITVALVSVLAVVGFAVYLGAEDKFISYGALYLMVPGVYATTPVLAAWMANNSESYYRRATSVAIGFIAANSGGILSVWRFPTSEGPKFRKTTVMNLIFSILVIVISLVNMAYLSFRNKAKKQPEKRAELLDKYMVANERGEYDDGKLRAWIELGDRHPDFVYTL
jgi:predicted MFS family arabinose efflux permease